MYVSEEWRWSNGGIILRRERSKYSDRTCPSATFCEIHAAWIELESNPLLRDLIMATDRLCHVAAHTCRYLVFACLKQSCCLVLCWEIEPQTTVSPQAVHTSICCLCVHLSALSLLASVSTRIQCVLFLVAPIKAAFPLRKPTTAGT